MLSASPIGLLWAASLGGTVFSEETAEPVYGATVSAVNQRLQIWQTTSGVLGGFILDGLPEGTWRLHIAAPQQTNLIGKFVDAETLCEARSWTLGATDQALGVEAALPPGGTIIGEIQDAQGRAIPDASVWAMSADAQNDGQAREARTDPSGAFEIMGLSTSSLTPGDWAIWVSAEGWPDQYLGPSYDSTLASIFTSGPDLQTQIGSHKLLNGITVEGTVSGPNGPVADATIHVYAGGQVVTIEPDSEGFYVAQGLPPGDVLPWASAEGLATTYFPDTDRPSEFLTANDEGETVEGADLVLPWESILQVQLFDPASGATTAEVSALLYNDSHTVGWGDKADEDGFLRFDGLHSGTYELYTWGSAIGFSDDWVRDASDENQAFTLGAETESLVHEIDLVPAGRLEGQVLDENGEPIGSAWVFARPDEGSSEAALTEADGSFHIGGLSPQTWRIEAVVSSACPGDPGYVSAWWPAQVNEDWASQIDLSEGEARQALEIQMPTDGDLDGMGDEWEDLWSLDSTRDDAYEDPDEDGYLNLSEYLLNTNPRGESRGCSVRRGPVRWALLIMIPLILRRRS